MAFVRFRALDTYVVATRRERLDHFEREGLERVPGGEAQRIVGKVLLRATRAEVSVLWQEVFGMPLSPRLSREDVERQLFAEVRATGRLVCFLRKEARHPAHTAPQPPMELSAPEVEAPPGHIMWIGFELLDQDGDALPGESFLLTAPDKSTKMGRLDARGRVREDPTLDGEFMFGMGGRTKVSVGDTGYLDIEIVESGGTGFAGVECQLSVGGVAVQSAYTNEEGRLHLTSLPPGPYSIVLPAFEPSAVTCNGKTAGAAPATVRPAATYLVRRGDTLARIARAHGLKGWRTLYDAPENEPLRRKRPNPDRIRPGDEVRLPAASAAMVSVDGRLARLIVETAATESRLELRLLGPDAAPLSDEPYELTAEGFHATGRLERGTLRLPLPAAIEHATLRITLGDSIWEQHLSIELERDDLSSMQTRLANLGYFAGTTDGRESPELSQAIAYYRREQALEPGQHVDPLLERSVEDEYTA